MHFSSYRRREKRGVGGGGKATNENQVVKNNIL